MSTDQLQEEKRRRLSRRLPDKRLVSTATLAGVIGEHPVTAHNKSNPNHESYDQAHPKPIRGPKGAPHRWWLPDAYDYIEILKQRSEERSK
jgi:hypothetical protein